MKKIFTFLFAAMACSFTCMAQTEEEIDETFQFVDDEGNVVPNGSVVTATTATLHPEGYYMIKPGFTIKNVSDDVAYCGIAYSIKDISNGVFQICFPQACVQQQQVGDYETGQGGLVAGENKDMQTEWCPLDYGTATVSYQVIVYASGFAGNYIPVGEGPTVTVNFVYSDPAGVDGVTAAGDVKETARYSLDGRRLSHPEKGINLVKTSDGKVRKVLVNK